jgi:hypothetical protein
LAQGGRQIVAEDLGSASMSPRDKNHYRAFCIFVAWRLGLNAEDGVFLDTSTYFSQVPRS